MTTQAKGTFTGGHWDEKPYDAPEGRPKLHRASEANTFVGDLEGTSTMEILISYSDVGGGYVGFERVTGKLGGKSGSFVLQLTGTFEGHAVKGSYTIAPGTATGELKGLRGQGGFTAQGMEPAPYTLDYEFE